MSDGDFAVVTPHPPIFIEAVGGARRMTARDSLEALQRASAALECFAPDTLFVMSPHAPGLSDAVVVDRSAELSGDLAGFGDPEIRSWQGDPALGSSLLQHLEAAGVDCVARDADPRLKPGWLDHGCLVPLEFLDPQRRYRLVIISLTWLPLEANVLLGHAARAAARDAGVRCAFVASGDLSHRLTPGAPAGFSPRGHELDERIVDAVTHGELAALTGLDPDLVEAGGECGLRSIIAAGGYVGSEPAATAILAYEGPWGVGYLTALAGDAAIAAAGIQPVTGTKGGSAGTDESPVVAAARATIEAHVLGRPLPAPSIDDPDLPARAGAFVSLHLGGELRGCIGTIAPTKPTLAEEVASNAVQAASHDPRFEPVTADELAALDVKVDVLQPPESCSIDDLDPSTYGVIVTSGWRRGLLLPDLEGVDDVATQVAIAMRKAGISDIQGCRFERFRVDRYT